MSNETKAFHLLCDKPNSSEISSTCLCPTSDLVAVLTLDGEVRLHRLYWGKVWSYTEKDSRITVTAWRPDGKVLAVGNDNGFIRLLETEKCNSLHLLDIGSPVTAMEWIETYEQEMSVLLAGTENGSIKLFVNGLFNVTSINESDGLENFGNCVVNVFMSKSLKLLASVHSGVVTGAGRHLKNLKFHKFELISSRTSEVKMIAMKYEKVDSLLQKLDAELTQISDSWENNLQKVSLKLEKLAEILPAETTVLEEFLMAFACGTLSAELQSFLINELTMKGLKKLGSDINSSYGNVRSKVVDNLQALCYDLSIELSELLGMARWYEKYGVLGLKERDVQDALNYLGTFVLKIKELLSVIERDLRSFRAFFKWLSGVMYRISDEPIPSVFKEFSQEENTHILEFLQTQLVKGKDQKSFVLDRVGQYLKEDEKDTKEVPANNPWYDFVQSEPLLRDNPLVIVPEKETSLAIMGKKLHSKVVHVFDSVTATMTESFTSKEGPAIFNEIDDHEDKCCPRVSWLQRQEGKDVIAYILPCSCKNDCFYQMNLDQETPSGFKVSKLSIDVSSIASQERDDSSQTVVRDIQFYNDENITLLLTEMTDSDSNPVSVLAQLDVAGLKETTCFNSIDSSLPATDATNCISKWRYIDTFEPMALSVSGTRKVSCLLSSNRRRIRIYDMDAEEDEDTDQSDDDSQLEDM